MTSGRTSKLIRKLKDDNWHYWNLERWRKYALWYPSDRKVIVPARGVMKWGYQDDESQD